MKCFPQEQERPKQTNKPITTILVCFRVIMAFDLRILAGSGTMSEKN